MQIDYIVDQIKFIIKIILTYQVLQTVDMEQKGLADYLISYLDLNSKDTVLDIGSNDGSLLLHFKEKFKCSRC